MAFPYQCLTALTKPSVSGDDWILFGASGPTLVVQSSSGVKSSWPPEQELEKVSSPDFVQSYYKIVTIVVCCGKSVC